MSVNFHDVLASVGLRISALTGTLGPALETAFNVRPLTTTQFQSTVFPFTACKFAVINAEEKLAHAIANAENHPWRRKMASTTGNLPNETAIGPNSTTGKPIIGTYGAVYDTTDGTVCTEKPLAVIRRRVRNAGSFPTGGSIYHYHIDDNRLYHTRTGATIDVCIYDRADAITDMNANSPIKLPDVLEEAYICGAVSMLVRDDEFTQQSGLYRQYFNDTLAQISAGFTAVPNKPKLAA